MNEFELKHTMFSVERDKTQQLNKDVAKGTRKAQATKRQFKGKMEANKLIERRTQLTDFNNFLKLDKLFILSHFWKIIKICQLASSNSQLTCLLEECFTGATRETLLI